MPMGHGVDRPSDLAIRPLKSQKPALAKGSLGSNPVIRTRLRVKPQPMPANVRQLIARHCKRQIIGSHWPALASIGGRVERAMGIEPTAQAWEAWVLPLYDARAVADSSRLSEYQATLPREGG